MNSRKLVLTCLASLLLCASTTMAQTPAAAAGTTSVVGYVWTANNAAVGDATVALRNTVSGEVAALTRTNAAGEFAFNGMPAGSYVVEFHSAGGRVLALGHPFTVAPGETVATFVRMSNAVPLLVPGAARVSLAIGGLVAWSGRHDGASPGGGLAVGLGAGRADLVGEASVVRRAGHNDWRLLGGGLLWLANGDRAGLFTHLQAGVLFRNGDAGFAVVGGAGVEWRSSGRLALRLSADLTNDTRESTGGRVALWLVRR